MRVLTLSALTIVSAALSACASTAPQARIAASNCSGLQSVAPIRALYEPGNIQKVEPIYTTQFLARAIQPTYVSGANVYVSAQPGMNEAYVERALSCHAASGSAGDLRDPLIARGVVDVDVSNAGTMMRIAIRGADRAAGKDIWQRARALYERGEVSVEQLSALSKPAM